MIFRRKLLPLALLAATSGTTFAQNNALEEVIVTAQKREQSLQDVSFQVQAMSTEEIKDSGITTFADLVTRVPSASFGQNFIPAQSVINFRGLTGNSEGTATTAYYIDDAPFLSLSQAEAPPVELFDMERVEVLKGPQGTLYGQAAMGATIRLITIDPDASAGFKGKVQVGATTFKDGDEGSNAALSLNIPLVEDQLAMNLVYSQQDRGAFIDLVSNVSGETLEEDINFYDSKHWRGKVLWTPSDELKVRLSYFHNEDDNRLGNQVDPDKIERLAVAAGSINTLLQNEVDITTLFVSYDMGFASFEQTISNTVYDICQQFTIPGAFAGAFCVENSVDYLETRLVSNSDGPFNWIVGGTYLDGKRDRPNEIVLIFQNNLQIRDFSDVKAESWGIFGEASLEMMDGFAELLVGLRYFEDERTSREFALDAAGNRTLNPGQPLIAKTDTVNPRINLTLRPSDNINVYFNAAKGFRPGGVNGASVRASAPAEIGREAPIWESDELWSYELGTKATLLDGSLYTEAAFYYTDWEDALFQAGGAVTGVAIAANIGNVKIKGLEFLTTWATPLEGLSISFSGNLVDTEITGIGNVVSTNVPGLSEGGDLPGVPKRTFNLGFDYATLISGDKEAYGRVDFSHRSEQTNASGISLTPIGTSTTADSFTLVNLRAGLRVDENWDVALFVNNATGEDGLMAHSYGLFPAVIRPTEYGISLTKEF